MRTTKYFNSVETGKTLVGPVEVTLNKLVRCEIIRGYNVTSIDLTNQEILADVNFFTPSKPSPDRDLREQEELLSYATALPVYIEHVKRAAEVYLGLTVDA